MIMKCQNVEISNKCPYRTREGKAEKGARKKEEKTLHIYILEPWVVAWLAGCILEVRIKLSTLSRLIPVRRRNTQVASVVTSPRRARIIMLQGHKSARVRTANST